MTVRQELREELLSVIAAAPELTPDARAHLADVFLDRLEQDYRLVPHGQSDSAPREMRRRRSLNVGFALWPLIPALLGLFVLFSLISTSAFVLVHPPILLFVILIAFLLRSRWWGGRRHLYL